jgi:hypothetical protein
VSSKARLAFDLFYFTGCRISDAILLGRAMEGPSPIQDDTRRWLTFTATKNSKKRDSKPTEISLPIAPALRASIDATAEANAHEQDDRSQHVKGGAQAQRGERARALATALDDGGADGAQARRAQGVRRALHPRPDRQRNGNRIPKNTPTFARCSVRWECFRQKGKRYQTRFLGVEAGSGIEPLYEDLQSSA